MADKKSLADLAALTNPEPEAPAVEEAVEVAADTATHAPVADTPVEAAAPAPSGDRRDKREQVVEDHGVSTQGPQIEAVLREQQLDKQGRAYATGRRKDAVARVWLKPGSGKIVVNGREQEVYFARPTLRLIINQVFDVTDRKGQYDVVATVKGGGLSGQAGAVRARHFDRADPLRAGAPHDGQARRLPDPRSVASSSARSTAAPKHAAASSSRSGKRFSNWLISEGAPGLPGRPFPIAQL